MTTPSLHQTANRIYTALPLSPSSPLTDQLYKDSTGTMAAAPATLTHPSPDVWVITMNSPPDNRLTPRMLLTLNKLVDTVEAEWRARED